MGGSSPYVKELTEKLAFVKTEVLARLQIEEVAREWFVRTYSLLICGVRRGILPLQAAGYSEICS
jgi:hypothetical protein